MGLPGLNQYLARINVLAQGHNAVTPARLKPLAPLPLSHCPPSVAYVTYQKSLK